MLCWEAIIKKISTNSKNFAKCNNSKCNSYFLYDPRELLGEIGMLCPTCRDKIHTHHIVQCKNCESIVDFVDADPSELPVIFYREKCPICSDSKEDGKGDLPYTSPEFIFD